MPDLHLTGVHEDDVHLLLAGADGTTYRLAIDDALRAAVRRGPAHAAHPGSSEPLRPVDVQAMIRAGATAHEAAERAGWPVEKVHRYEGPILAERAHVAGLAGGAHLRGRSGQIVTLADRVAERLQQRGVDPDDADWDAWRSQDGQWTVDISFSAGGRRRTASWHFSRSSMTVTPVDDESRWLGEDDASEPAPAQREVVARQDVYDVENDRRERRRVEPPDTDSEIMASLRERAAARTHRRRTPRRLPTQAPDQLSAPAAPEVGFTTSSPTDVPAPSAELPDDAVPLEPHGFDPDTMPAPPAAHAEPDVEAGDGSPEPAAAPYAEKPAARRRTRARRVSAPATQEPAPDLLADEGSVDAPADSASISAAAAPSLGHDEGADERPERAVERSRSVASDTVDEPELPLDEHDDHDESGEVEQSAPASDDTVGASGPDTTGRAAVSAGSAASVGSDADHVDPAVAAQVRSGGETPTAAPTETPSSATPAGGTTANRETPAAAAAATESASKAAAKPSARPAATASGSESEGDAPASRPRRATKSTRSRQAKPAQPTSSRPTPPATTPPAAAPAAATRPTAPADDEATEAAEAPPAPAPKRPNAKRGRASVPAWDDIMFGAKPE